MNDTTLGLYKTNNRLVVAYKRVSTDRSIYRIDQTLDGQSFRDEYESEEELLAAFRREVA